MKIRTVQPPLPETFEAARAAVRRNFYDTDRMFKRIGATADHLPDAFADVRPIDEETGTYHFHNAAWIPGTTEYRIGHVPNGPSFAFAKDVNAHERSHAVVDTYAHLIPVGETGAVNESLADTFAMDVDKRNWTVGESVMPGGMRSLRNPSRDQDAVTVVKTDDSVLGQLFGLGGVERQSLPTNYRDYMDTGVDNGGVHVNMGIPNRAAYVIGSKLGRDDMATLYLAAIRDHLNADTIRTPKLDRETLELRAHAKTANLLGFGGLAKSTIEAAQDIYRDRPQHVQVVKDAWASVGLTDREIAKSLDEQHASARQVQMTVDQVTDVIQQKLDELKLGTSARMRH